MLLFSLKIQRIIICHLSYKNRILKTKHIKTKIQIWTFVTKIKEKTYIYIYIWKNTTIKETEFSEKKCSTKNITFGEENFKL